MAWFDYTFTMTEVWSYFKDTLCHNSYYQRACVAIKQEFPYLKTLIEEQACDAIVYMFPGRPKKLENNKDLKS